jgi:2-C-methyl-D-erythritol 4-phosphate cytidylyltransferase
MIPFSVVLLAGGIGSRMKTTIPKQFLHIQQKPIASYSFDLFLSLPEIEEIIVVCESSYQSLFVAPTNKRLLFANPGERRQDSVHNGIQLLEGNPLVCIHDSARPLIEVDSVRQVVNAAAKWNAATLAVPVYTTIKMCDEANSIIQTVDRSCLWEAQTPQVVRLNTLKQGLKYAQAHQLTVTDDVSLVELIGQSAKIIQGKMNNIKVTTLEDLYYVQWLIETCSHTN